MLDVPALPLQIPFSLLSCPHAPAGSLFPETGSIPWSPAPTAPVKSRAERGLFPPLGICWAPAKPPAEDIVWACLGSCVLCWPAHSPLWRWEGFGSCTAALADEDLGEQGSHLEAAACSQQWDGLTGSIHTLGGQILVLLLLQRPCSPLLLLLGWSQASLEQQGTLGNSENVLALHSAPAPLGCLMWPLPEPRDSLEP